MECTVYVFCHDIQTLLRPWEHVTNVFCTALYGHSMYDYAADFLES